MNKRQMVISCHADTGFEAHALTRNPDGTVFGHLDNYAGVYAVMKAYFSGRLNQPYLRVELTYGEEDDFEGAYEVLDKISEHDVVIVVDVTAAPITKDFTIEKCESQKLKGFLESNLDGLAFDLYRDCPDPLYDEDEVDVYSEKCKESCFIGVPVYGGDYNEEKVYCREQCIDAVAEALCRIAENFSKFDQF